MILVPGKGKDVLIDLINQSNVLPYPLTSNEVLFSDPKVVVGPLPTAVNSLVLALPGSNYDGFVTVQWERMDLTSAFGGMVPRVGGLSSGNLHSMLPWIGRELGIQLLPEDFIEVDWSSLGPNESANVRLKAEVNSMNYTGEFIIQFTRLRPSLDMEFKSLALNVYKLPGEVTPGKRQVNMATYGRDFTGVYESIMRHPYYNIFNDGTAVRQVMSGMGYVNWPVGWDNPIADYATSEIPESNKDYDRVIVQQVKDIEGMQVLPYEGTAYFHYNVA